MKNKRFQIINAGNHSFAYLLIVIVDIDNETLHSIVKSCADDTRATKSIKSIADVQKLQSDLQLICDWTVSSNMELNDIKLELLWYGLNKIVKSVTECYTPRGKIIATKNSVKQISYL